MKKPDVHRLLLVAGRPSLRPLFAIPTHLTSREKAALFRSVRLRAQRAGRPLRVVEIGSYLGASASFFAAALAGAHGGQVLCIDTWGNDAMSDGRRDTRSEFLANTAAYDGIVMPVQGWSHDADVVARVRAAGPIDVLFVDGDHSYEGVQRDWLTYEPLLAPGALVMLHDIGWAEGVQRLVAEIAPRFTSVGRLRNLWWGTCGG